MTLTVKIEPEAAGLAEDKDYARQVRMREILPALDRNEHIVLDFSGISFATQSFVHALLGEALKRHGEAALELLEFRKCSKQLKDIVEIVVDYSLGGFDDDKTD